MMHTPEQARELWCPMVRMVRFESGDPSARSQDLQVVGGCNSGGKAARSPVGCRCIADQCAMWRWSPNVGPDPFAEPGVLHAPVMLPPVHGYCGIAGRPEVA